MKPILDPENRCTSFWISKNQKPLQGKTITEIVKKISFELTKKNLRPSDYRRIIPSLLFKNLLEDPPENDMNQFLFKLYIFIFF